MSKNQMIEKLAKIWSQSDMLTVENITVLHKMRAMKKAEVEMVFVNSLSSLKQALERGQDRTA